MAEENNMQDLKKQTLGSVRNDMLEPTKAIIEAAGMAGDAWTKRFLETNFVLEKQNGGIDLSKPMRARMIDCEFEVIKNGVAGLSRMKVPLLSIAPTPCVAMSTGKIVHDYEINVAYDDTSAAGVEAGYEAGASGSIFGVGGFTSKTTFTATANIERKRHTDARAAIHVEQEFTQIPLSEGFLRLQEALLAAATPE